MTKKISPVTKQPEKLLTLEEAAAFLGTSKPTLYRLLDQNRLKGRKVGNQWRFLQADLQAYLDRGAEVTVLPSIPRELFDPEWEFLAGELKTLGRKPTPLDGDAQSDSEKRLQSLVGALLTLGVAVRASDIHLESIYENGELQALLRLRVDGVLKELRRMPAPVAQAVNACFKRYMHMDPEIRRPQDGRMLVRIEDREVDFRASILPTIFGESLVLRILDRQGIVLGLDNLGLSEPDKARLRDLARRSHGLLVFSGPTGCGKTTLVYSLLQEIARSQVKTITIEDPVELAMPWATQLQIDPGKGITFAPALRSAMRQDPDILFVGEIRDQETMLGCIQAALTGHLVLTTLHAPDTIESVLRIKEMGIEPFLIASALLGVVSERLVRKICPDCGEPAPLANGSRAKVSALAEPAGFPLPAKARFRSGRGCPQCFGSGFRGRTGVFEVLEFTPALKDGFLKGLDKNALRSSARGQGSVALVGDGLRKAAEGTTSIEEILRVFSTDGY